MSRRETTPTSNNHNVLSRGTTIVGNIKSEEDFRIDGTIEGNIICQGKIIIGPEGKIIGEVRCSVLDILGTHEGNIFCSDTAILRESALVLGDIKTQVLEVEPGARVKGSFDTFGNTDTYKDITTTTNAETTLNDE